MDALVGGSAAIAALLPKCVRMGRVHWGRWTPTVLSPKLTGQLARALRMAVPPADDFEFSIEIDPTQVDADKIATLAEAGMSRASIGIQDFAPEV